MDRAHAHAKPASQLVQAQIWLGLHRPRQLLGREFMRPLRARFLRRQLVPQLQPGIDLTAAYRKASGRFCLAAPAADIRHHMHDARGRIQSFSGQIGDFIAEVARLVSVS